ncbi:MAG TPA: hypothetical protein DIU14_03040, partial [Actinobacteria bacterium]|nr:hypothetical protein [Actinomycetota bacterium]
MAGGRGEPAVPADGARRGADPGAAAGGVRGPERHPSVLPQQRGGVVPPRAVRTPGRRVRGDRVAGIERHHARRVGRPNARPRRRTPPHPGGSDSVNLADLLRATADARPDKAAILFQGRPVSFGDLDDRVDLTAGALSALGVVKGDRVGILAGNVPEFVSCLYGIVRLGAVACPLNVQLTPEEFTYILADAGAKVIIT